MPGYKKVQPMVYCGFYPIDGSQYEALKIALDVKSDDENPTFYDETDEALEEAQKALEEFKKDNIILL